MKNTKDLAYELREKRIAMYKTLSLVEKFQAFSIDGVDVREVLYACSFDEVKLLAKIFKISDERIQQAIQEELFVGDAYCAVIAEEIFNRKSAA